MAGAALLSHKLTEPLREKHDAKSVRARCPGSGLRPGAGATRLGASQALISTDQSRLGQDFPKSSKVEHRKVSFKNRYGIKLAADLYLPSNHGTQRHGALVVDGPFGSVKEQASGFYAQNMAERGYIAVAFDRSYTGESGGEPSPTAHREAETAKAHRG